MKDEINKIIQSISDFYKLDNALKYYLDRHKAQILLDYITNLQENARGQVNDYFKDKYADEVLKNAKLQEENERLEKRNIYYINNEKNLLSDWHQEHNEAIEYKSRNEKAIEYIKEKISSTQGVINDYMYHKEHNKILIELLKEDIEMYKKELHILSGDEEC